MFYTIYVNQIMLGIRHERMTLGHYRRLDNAREALMDWARSVLRGDREKKYTQLSADPRASEKTVLKVRVATRDLCGMEGAIVENAFVDETASFILLAADLLKRAREAVRGAIAPGDTVTFPFDRDNKDGKNVTVTAFNDYGDYGVEIASIRKDGNGRILITGVDDDGKDVHDLDEYYLTNEAWTAFADAVRKVVAKNQAT